MKTLQQSPAPLAASSGLGDGRLRKHADYQRVYKATRKQFSSSMSWFGALRSPLEEGSSLTVVNVPDAPRVGLTVGKVIGKAHERNRIKRRLRELVKRHLHELPNDLDLVLHPKKSVMTMDFAKLDAEIVRIFRQAKASARPSVKPQAGTQTSPQAHRSTS